MCRGAVSFCLWAKRFTVDGGDSHLLPFDGNIDFDEVMRDLAKSGYQGSLMLEVFSGIYPNMTTDEFMKTAYDRAKRLLKLIEKYENE